jgi:hypothetical protein
VADAIDAGAIPGDEGDVGAAIAQLPDQGEPEP